MNGKSNYARYRASYVRYNTSAKGHAAHHRYNVSKKGRARLRRYVASEKGRLRQRAYESLRQTASWYSTDINKPKVTARSGPAAIAHQNIPWPFAAITDPRRVMQQHEDTRKQKRVGPPDSAIWKNANGSKNPH